VTRRWVPLGLIVLLQIGYPLVPAGRARAGLVIATVLLGFATSAGHALLTRGPRVGLVLVAVTAGGGLAVEAVGVHTGFPFGGYGYSGALGPRLLGVPLVVPLAWTWMAWPAWLAGSALAPAGRRLAVTAPLAGLALAAWDLFLDPQMVVNGYWRWTRPSPGWAGVPLTNYLGWLAVALVLMAGFGWAAGMPTVRWASDAPMLALYLWTYVSSVLAHAVFLGLPGSALAGALGMGLVAVPLALRWRAAPC
jgi:putative membrane protein